MEIFAELLSQQQGIFSEDYAIVLTSLATAAGTFGMKVIEISCHCGLLLEVVVACAIQKLTDFFCSDGFELLFGNNESFTPVNESHDVPHRKGTLATLLTFSPC